MSVSVTQLAYEDELLVTLDLPARPLKVLRGLGSGLSRSPEGRIYAVGDRGPNLKVKLAIERFGLTHLASGSFASGAKLMPSLDHGPALCELAVGPDRVKVVRVLPLRDRDGKPVRGLPIPGGAHCEIEPALDCAGTVLAAEAGGVDTEGVVALADGGFWVGDEYGPSLLRLDPNGVVVERWVPAGLEQALTGSPFPVRGNLPAIAARRQLNRGFEAIGISPDQRTLYLAFQSPLAHPDETAHEQGRWVRVWSLDAATGALLAQYAYPLDAPETFRRDRAKGKLDWSDLKVSELTVVAENRLLMLERGSQTTKLYLVELADEKRLDRDFADPSRRPTLEQLSREEGAGIPLLDKRLVLSTDDHPQMSADMEGLVLLSPTSLLMVNDNDFGIEDVATCFWRVDLDAPL